MKLKKPGKNTLATEVVAITPHGLWLHINEVEYFLAFSEYPWFKEARIIDVQDVSLINDHHLHWASLDVDLELESLSNLEKYPLKFQS